MSAGQDRAGNRALSGLPEVVLAAWVESSCAAQGVPVKVTDPGVMRQVATLLGQAPSESRADPRSGSTRHAGDGSEVAPHDVHAGVVQGPGARLSRADGDVVDDRSGDGLLTVEVQGRPLAS